MLVSIKKFCRLLLDSSTLVWLSVRFYCFGKQPTTRMRMAMMRMHCNTNGLASEVLASVYRLFEGKRTPKPVSGFLGELSESKQAEIVKSIDEDGFYVFQNRLPAELCDAIEKLARETPAGLEGRGISPEELEVFDAENPKSKTYRLRELDIARNPSMQTLMADPSILAIAEQYIGATPNLSMLNLWWSANYGSEPGADAAQMFHFDFDPPPKWLLFFVYLTDVGPNNGPHVFARGTHRAGHPAAADLLSRGYVRISDEEIAQTFGPDNVVEIHAPRGTVLAVDTRGFHKGKVLSEGYRLMAQLTYSFPVFAGAHGGVEPLNPESVTVQSLLSAAKSVPRAYSRYLPSH